MECGRKVLGMFSETLQEFSCASIFVSFSVLSVWPSVSIFLSLWCSGISINIVPTYLKMLMLEQFNVYFYPIPGGV